ncbi:murein L,D-transpeptidase [Alsobacter metallidurans]|uniref:Murein L,D-transpeptidase n=1 Tax=Alsobacter metallidurans TaxID=340221 RepID=A0A917MHM0_9HYPH|nr:L,D-transpeptidase family protein [Alsobacter metallidurans]GGH17660.1 murein L,D-transpeptidase [Alsobacter metallidurans]
MRRVAWVLLLGAVACPLGAQAKSSAPKFDLEAVNAAGLPPEAAPPKAGKANAKAPPAKFQPGYLKAQVLLDRQHFSPGSIDGKDGENFHKALTAFQQSRQLPVTGKLDQATWVALNQDAKPALTRYEIKKSDIKGPFTKTIPAQLEKQAKLDRLGYKNPKEMFSERFHLEEALLAQLNPGKSFKKAGDEIVVPDVAREGGKIKVSRVEIDKQARLLRAFGEDGALVAAYPASIGSDDKPAPSGSFKITGVARNPVYHYNPKYAFKGVKTNEPFTVAAGPNNPVGAVWIDLSEPSYGIHGTAEPSRIGRTYSHGCVRLTNWDVSDLAGMVKKGVETVFEDTSPPQIETGAIAQKSPEPQAAPAQAAPPAVADAKAIPSFVAAPPLSATKAK